MLTGDETMLWNRFMNAAGLLKKYLRISTADQSSVTKTDFCSVFFEPEVFFESYIRSKNQIELKTLLVIVEQIRMTQVFIDNFK